MNVLIVEDEELAVDRLIDQLGRYDSNINILDRLDTIQDTVDFLKEHDNIDLTFLDIQLSDGKSFEIFKHVEPKHPVIFTTAYDQYALSAFKVNTVDYLLKPIDFEDLKKALDKFKKYQGNYNWEKPDQQKIHLNQLENIIKGFQNNYKKRFIVKFGDHIQFKPVEEISHLFADGKIVYIVLKGNNRRYIIDHTLEELENMLLDPDLFFRINRKYIIKLDDIDDVRSYANGRLKIFLKTPSEQDLIVSREKVAEFKDWLNQ